MGTVDLTPAARRTADLIGGISDNLLDAPTPCLDYTLGDLLDHVGTLALAFTWAAKKESLGASPVPSGDASRLGDDWRTRIPRDLLALAAAWRDPDAWTGMTEAGGVELPGEIAGLIALNEVVTHGWDMARASGQLYDPDHASLEAVHGFLAPTADSREADANLFGPVVEVADDAPLLDRVIGLTGRDPAWSAS
jgi:uncharacterized protein (TIGR03086 family)